MSFLGRFRKGGLSKPNTPQDPADRSVWLGWGAPVNVVVGEDHYQDTFKQILGEPREEGYLQLVPVSFVREPENQYDPNALKAQLGDYLVGYLRREQAEDASTALDTAGVSEFMVAGLVRGGDTTYEFREDFSILVWPNRLMTKGPVIDVDPERDTWATVRGWPPFAKEGRPDFDLECEFCGSFQLIERPDGLYNCKRCGEVTGGS